MRLRLNPNENGKKEGPATRAVLAALTRFEDILAAQNLNLTNFIPHSHNL
jgi:hypothetical protein